MLQETHSVTTDEKKWSREWEGTVLMAHGTNQARGTAILIPKRYTCEILNIQKDEKGTFIFVDGIFNGSKMALINYYGPTADKNIEQHENIRRIIPYLTEISHHLIWAGAFNTCLAPEFDKYGLNKIVTKFSETLLNIMEEFDLVDIWRIRNPELKRYTWRKNTFRGIQQSRLDYWLVPTSYIYRTQNCEISTGVYSDHSVISLEICTENEKDACGKGTWKRYSASTSPSRMIEKNPL